MKFNVLALDYDGTIARDGRAHPDVLSAIRDAKGHGVVVILVTGRIIADLRHVLPEADLFDAIVAENGAVIVFPNGRVRTLGQAPSEELLAELCARGIGCSFGDCVVEAAATDAPQILEIIRKLRLPLVLAFNHGRVMILPQGLSKASGLRETLDTLRLSLHNCIGIGDGENDYAMLDACEIGVAVEWGRKELHKIADHVLPGRGPEALAAYIREVSSHAKLPPVRAKERRVLLGESLKRPVKIEIHGRNILIAGDPRSGKSWITGLFCEHLLLEGYCLCMIDPEGDYSTLESLPGVVVFGGDESPPRLSDVVRALRHPDTSIIIDLSAISHEEKCDYVRELLPMLASLRCSTGLPHWVVIDEAHYFLHLQEASRLADLELCACVLITYRPSHLDPEILDAVETIITTSLTDPEEAGTLIDLCRASEAAPAWREILAGLGIDEAALLPRHRAEGALPTKFTIAPRLTTHVRHRSKYLEVPMPAGRAFYFTCHGQNFGAPVRTLKEFVRMQELLPAESLEGHAQRGDFSSWIADVFGDAPLAKAIRKVEDRYRRGRVHKLSAALVKPIRDRYELSV